MGLKKGQNFTFVRQFTREDVETFAEVSGDRGIHHMTPDAKGKIMLQGLLTATLPTKLGGDLNYIARTMAFEFPRPVFAGDTITAEATVEDTTETTKGTLAKIRYVCRNQEGKEVLVGSTQGIVRRQSEPSR
jgi:acyl dehydratase